MRCQRKTSTDDLERLKRIGWTPSSESFEMMGSEHNLTYYCLLRKVRFPH